MFHMAYLLGSYIARGIINMEYSQPGADAVLLQLNIAHILVPIFSLLSIWCDMKQYYVISKMLDMISIFQYQATIFFA